MAENYEHPPESEEPQTVRVGIAVDVNTGEIIMETDRPVTIIRFQPETVKDVMVPVLRKAVKDSRDIGLARLRVN